MTRSRFISRRRFLHGVGGLTLALPWLEQFHSGRALAADLVPLKRVVVVTYGMGIPVKQWRPAAVGSTFDLPYVTKPLEAFKSRLLMVSDLDHTALDEGGSAFSFGHPGKMEASLTGTLTTGAFPTSNTNSVSEILTSGLTNTGGANGESLEQRIGKSLGGARPFKSVDLGVDGDKSLNKIASSFCFESRGTPVSLECNPQTAFTRFFAGITGGQDTDAQVALRELKARNKSVLDAVRASFGELAKGLGADDKRRLDEHAARIRQIELDTTPPPTCTQPTGIPVLTTPRMDQAAAPQIKLLAQAMACDLAPIGRLEFVNQQSPRFGIADLDSTLDAVKATYDWHGMVHGDPLPGTTTYLRPGRDANTTTFDQRLLDGYRFFVQQFANLLTALDSFAEGPGTTVLDHSMVILATDFGDGGGHYHGKMGYIVAGNLGPGRKGFHFAGAPNSDLYTTATYNVSQFHNSVLDMAQVTDANGQPVNDFGLKGFTKVGQAAPHRRPVRLSSAPPVVAPAHCDSSAPQSSSAPSRINTA